MTVDSHSNPTDGRICKPMIPQIPPADETQTEPSAPPNPSNSTQPEWQRVLDHRGILHEALKAGWTSSTWKDQPGWAIPLHDEDSRPLKLPDGRPAQRWKRLGGDTGSRKGAPKYRWGYPDSQKGEAKPDGCDFYCVPHVNLRQAIAASQGELVIACGEPDMLTFLAAGTQNVISFFGEGNIPRDLSARLKTWGVRIVHYYPDRDDTGRAAVDKLASTLHSSGVELLVYELPSEVEGRPIKDINDLYCALECGPERFNQALTELPVAIVHLSEGDAKQQLRKAKKRAEAARDLPPAYYDAVEKALNISGYQPDGWSKPIPCPFKQHEHDDREPAAAYHRDKHIVHCFKCHRTWLAIEVGEVLGIDWRDYRGNTGRRHTQSKTGHAKPAPDGADSGWDKLPPPTDDEMGDALMDRWDGNVAYFYEQWYRYGDGVWQPYTGIAEDVWEIQKAYKSRGIRPNRSMANSIRDYLQAKLRVPDERVDQADGYINLANGLYNIEMGQLEPHRRDLYLTTKLGFAYDPMATCPTWGACLSQWFDTPNGQRDSALIALLQEGFGYSLTADTSYETAFWLVGPAASGKSTILKVLAYLAGPGHISLDLNMLDRNPYQLADLPGKRVATCTEARVGSVLADHMLKTLISGEELPARQIYGKTIRFAPKAKLWWAMNEWPANRDRSDAIYRRLQIIPCRNSVPRDEQDQRLVHRLQSELPGIFNWAMQGLKQLYAHGSFTQADQADLARAQYRLENDEARAFVEEWCVVGQGRSVQAQTLYDGYKLWCERNGYQPMSTPKAARLWEQLGFTKSQNGVRSYHGVDLTEEARQALGRARPS